MLTARDAGMEGRTDDEQLTFAMNERRVMVTSNRHDYARLNALWLRTNHNHAGIVILNRQNQDIGFVLRALEAIRRRGSDTTNLYEFI